MKNGKNNFNMRNNTSASCMCSNIDAHDLKAAVQALIFLKQFFKIHLY